MRPQLSCERILSNHHPAEFDEGGGGEMTRHERLVLLSNKVLGEALWLPDDVAQGLTEEAIAEAQSETTNVRFVIGAEAEVGGRNRFVSVVSPDIELPASDSDHNDQ
ncbi:hypothetical protein QCE62_14365 [Caballeronia sp. LZ033]|uniref:hypothetical protein n=1 Tax=Caballeronia sp. LZ033 TaxID=3038566 RepID=UPI0028563CAF|nr:hypothetical protein [Caballeronia sp. LZ033]MDR5814765.1 hypothetical protein [Caballeronia sp. LZ033]